MIVFPSLAPDFSTYADEEAREQRIQDETDRRWADKEILSEVLSEVTDYAPAHERTRYSRELGIVKTGEMVPARTAGLEALQIAQAWRDTPCLDERGRDVLALAFGRAMLNSAEEYIAEAATDAVDGA